MILMGARNTRRPLDLVVSINHEVPVHRLWVEMKTLLTFGLHVICVIFSQISYLLLSLI